MGALGALSARRSPFLFSPYALTVAWVRSLGKMSLVQVLGCRAIGAVSHGCGSAGLYAPALPALAPHATSLLNPSFIPPCCEQCGLTFDCGWGLTSGALPYIHAVDCRALGAMSPGCGSARLYASALPALALHATSLLNPSFPAIQCGFTSDCGLGLTFGGCTLHSCAGRALGATLLRCGSAGPRAPA